MKQAASIGDSLRKDVAKAAKALILEIDSELRKSTPVDTGHARANWVPSVGQPHTGEAQGDAAHASGVGQVIGYELSMGPLYVSNGVPYVQNLNYGSSRKAPAMFVEAAVDRALAKIERKFGAGAVGFSSSEYRSETGAAGAANMASAYNPLGGSDD